MTPLDVFFHDQQGGSPQLIGNLEWQDGRAWFKCSELFLSKKLNIAPFGIRRTAKPQPAPMSPFRGIHGVFRDSLPDGWGSLLIDSFYRQREISSEGVSPISRLAYLGNRTMGALTYSPCSQEFDDDFNPCALLDVEELAHDAALIFHQSKPSVSTRYLRIGAPTGGARPKFLVGFNGKSLTEGAHELPKGFGHWILKVPTDDSYRERCEGKVEHIYTTMARNARIQVPKTKLIKGENGDSYFMTKRFDKTKDGNRIHVASVAGLLHADYRVPSISYTDLFRLSDILTKRFDQKVKLFKQMVFNVVVGNRDDHAKNFEFLLNDSNDWVAAPAFDLTWNVGINGEHSTSINGDGKDISAIDIEAVARQASIPNKVVRSVVSEICEATLGWQSLAQDYDVPRPQIQEIKQYIDGRCAALAPLTRLQLRA